ncbi:serine hydrolase domain-containing protein [Bacillus sp. M6-12]|uniref:serine hydrolase domain-containing protein n=1 Tax=Bacillus sp. M6-12 TaxID=2054166 RepID=UPI00115A1A0C|nr:serine hydrolase domain-containing protein [Bacillus sp. M6-12]
MKLVKIVMLCLLLSMVFPSNKVRAEDKDIYQQIDRYIQKEMAAAHITGLSLGIVKDKEIVHMVGYGNSGNSKRKLTPQTPFILGSTAKSFTAMAIMQLAETGKIDLDASIQTYLPEVKLPKNITVRNLLNQASGLPRTLDWSNAESEVKADHIGTVFEYSNENYKLLGDIVTSVTGIPYGVYIKENIIKPLEMKNSFVSEAEAEKHGLAAGHITLFGFNVPKKMPFHKNYLAAGYLISSAEDMAHFLIAQMNDGRYKGTEVLSDASIAQMHKPAVKAPIFGEDSYYGMGWVNSSTNGIPTIWHSGEVPNYHSTMIMVPDHNYGIILLANMNNSILTSGLIEKIASGITEIMASQEPGKINSSAFYQTYAIMYAVLLIIIILMGLHIKNIKSWKNSFLNRKLGFFKLYIQPLFFNFLLPSFILFQLPQLLGFTWPFLLDFVPDASGFLILCAIVLFAVGLCKLSLIFSGYIQYRANQSGRFF